MELADRFGLPVISLVDTAGAFPGIEAEERGQAEAIARSTDACLALGVPNVARHHRRGRLGRRDRDRRLQPRPDARARDLHGGLARSGRLDPVARLVARPGSGDQHEDHRAGSAQVRHHRRDRARAAGRRASRSGGGGRRRPAGRSATRSGRCTTWGRTNCATRERRSSSRSAAKSSAGGIPYGGAISRGLPCRHPALRSVTGMCSRRGDWTETFS